MGNRTLGFIFSLCLAGCQSLPQTLDARKTFQQDMLVEVNGVKNEGAFVAPESSRYALKIETRGRIDLMVVKSCNREIKIDRPVKGGLFGRGRAMEFEFTPNERERSTRCALELSALNEDSRNSFAFIAFESARYALPAQVECNGESRAFSGTSVCQSRAGLKQMLKFNGAVHMASLKPECEIDKPVDSGELVFKLRAGFCEYVFQEKAKPYRRHRLYAIGYEDFIVKGLEQ